MKKINLNFPVISDEEIDAVSSVLRSGMLAQGTKVSEFEETIPDSIKGKKFYYMSKTSDDLRNYIISNIVIII